MRSLAGHSKRPSATPCAATSGPIAGIGNRCSSPTARVKRRRPLEIARGRFGGDAIEPSGARSVHALPSEQTMSSLTASLLSSSHRTSSAAAGSRHDECRTSGPLWTMYTRRPHATASSPPAEAAKIGRWSGGEKEASTRIIGSPIRPNKGVKSSQVKSSQARSIGFRTVVWCLCIDLT
jgi:hypothetical protein